MISMRSSTSPPSSLATVIIAVVGMSMNSALAIANDATVVIAVVGMSTNSALAVANDAFVIEFIFDSRPFIFSIEPTSPPLASRTFSIEPTSSPLASRPFVALVSSFVLVFAVAIDRAAAVFVFLSFFSFGVVFFVFTTFFDAPLSSLKTESPSSKLGLILPKARRGKMDAVSNAAASAAATKRLLIIARGGIQICSSHTQHSKRERKKSKIGTYYNNSPASSPSFYI